MGTVLYEEVLTNNLLNATFYNAATGMMIKADYFIILHYLCMRHFEIAGVLLLMTIMSVCLGIFLCFHLYITSCNLTTNEYFKWRAIRAFHKKETKKYQQALKDGAISTSSEKTVHITTKLSGQSRSDFDTGCTGPVEEASPKVDFEETFNPGPIPKNIYK